MSARILVSWSSGKDSMMALRKVRAEGYQVEALFSLLREDDRVSVHGVPRELLQQQAQALGLPLEIAVEGGGVDYKTAVGDALKPWRETGVDTIAYGDLLLEDIKAWRDAFHDEIGWKCLYPIWKSDTRELAEVFIDLGYRAVVTCVDTKRLDASFAGRDYDRGFLEDLPSGIDPCGENGEFHTFVFDGPEFARPVSFERSRPERRRFEAPGHSFDFGFCDLRPIAPFDRS